MNAQAVAAPEAAVRLRAVVGRAEAELLVAAIAAVVVAVAGVLRLHAERVVTCEHGVQAVFAARETRRTGGFVGEVEAVAHAIAMLTLWYAVARAALPLVDTAFVRETVEFV